MANEGILANAAITAFAAAAYLYLAVEVQRRRRASQDGRTLAGLLLYAIVGVHLFLAALRQVVAYVGQTSPAIARLEEPVFFLAATPAAFAIVPIAYMAAYALTGRDLAARVVSALFVGLASTGMFFVSYGGLAGPSVGYWGTEWAIVSGAAKGILFVFMLTALIAGGVLVHASRRASGETARRIRLVGLSILVYYSAFTFDALGEPNVWLLLERIVMAAAALLGYRAYFPPRAASGSREPLPH